MAIGKWLSFPGKAAGAMKIDEGKHCFWLVLSGKNVRVRAGQLTQRSGGK